MKKSYFCLAVLSFFIAGPALAATKTAVKVTGWQPVVPEGYALITWAKAPGIVSYFKAPDGSGSIDFLTRIYLPQNQIDAIISTTTPTDLGPANPNFLSNDSVTDSSEDLSASSTATTTDSLLAIDYRNLSFTRIAAEKAKVLSPAIKFLWDISFFNMKPYSSDLSLALKYTASATTTVTSGSRSEPDMARARRMLVVNNQKGLAIVKDFDSVLFVNNKEGDLALEGFAPTVPLSDDSTNIAARLFLGVTKDSKELVVYCSHQATVEDASNALLAAGVPVEQQLQADGGGSTACGYNLPGQFFVEPIRSLPVLMGAETILARGTIITDNINVRSGPSTKNSIVTKLAKGTLVRVYEEKSGWYRIADGQWVSKSLVKKN